MTDGRPLWADRELAVSTIAGSTAHRAAELAELVGRTLETAAARADQARQRSQERSDRISAGIVTALEALPVDTNAWTIAQLVRIVDMRFARKGPEHYGLRAIPTRDTIRAALRAHLSRPVPVLEPAHLAANSRQTRISITRSTT